MNKTEKRYAEELERRVERGEVIRWEYEPERLRLADNTYYVPDFRIVLTEGDLIEFHEVKGRRGGTYYATDKGKLKVKVAAEQHPYVFAIVWERPDGTWDREEH